MIREKEVIEIRILEGMGLTNVRSNFVVIVLSPPVYI